MQHFRRYLHVVRGEKTTLFGYAWLWTGVLKDVHFAPFELLRICSFTGAVGA